MIAIHISYNVINNKVNEIRDYLKGIGVKFVIKRDDYTYINGKVSYEKISLLRQINYMINDCEE